MAMPFILRNQVALALLVGIFLIPLGLSSLRGLTHVLTCEDPVATPFTVDLDEPTPVVLSAVTVVPGQPETLCGALELDIIATALEDRRVELEFVLTNQTAVDWRGTIDLELGEAGRGVGVPVSVGVIEAGTSHRESVELRVREGATDITGSLLLGP